MMFGLFEEMFELVGCKLFDYVDLKELIFLYVLNFGDKVFMFFCNCEDIVVQIKELFFGNEDYYLRFMQDEEVKFGKVMFLLCWFFGKLIDYLCKDVIMVFLKLDVNNIVYGILFCYFIDECLCWVFMF